MAGMWIKIRRTIGSNCPLWSIMAGHNLWIKMTLRLIRVADIYKDDAALFHRSLCASEVIDHRYTAKSGHVNLSSRSNNFQK